MLYSSLVQRIKPPKEGRYRTPAALKALRVSLLKPVASPFVISVMIFILQELPRAKAVITLLCLFCVTLYAQKNKPLTPAPKAPSIIFTDIAPKSNFAYRTNNNYVGKKYFPQPMCGGVAVFDYNNDGWKDFYSANGDLEHSSPNAKQYDSMFENQGGKMFTDVSVKLGADFMHSGYQRGSAFSDLNNDGWLDLVVTSLDAMLNAANNKAHWLLVKLIGKQSNCDSIGAKIKVTTASGRTLFNHVTTSAGFMSSSDLRAHFGLGNESVINAVEIIWPNGAKQILRNVMADKILQIEEPMTGTKIKD